MSLSRIPSDVQQHVLTSYLPLQDVSSVRQTNREYRNQLANQDVQRTTSGSFEAFQYAIDNDDPVALDRFVQNLSTKQLQDFYYQRYAPQVDPSQRIRLHPEVLYSDILLEAILQDDPRIVSKLVLDGYRLDDLLDLTLEQANAIVAMADKLSEFADSIDEIVLDELVDVLVNNNQRSDALKITLLTISRMDPEFLTNIVRTLLFPNEDYRVGMGYAHTLLYTFANPENKPLLRALLGISM